jgi:nucleoside-diphosphate-sugar epimerase
MKNVLIIGGNGYVGSRLRQVLAQIYTVASVDCCWYNYDETSKRTDYHKLTQEYLEQFDAVVLLAGHGSVASCNGDIQSPWLNNVTNFTDLAAKLSWKNIPLIYASSASVYGNSLPGQLFVESNKRFIPVNNYDITKYTLDLEAQIAINQGQTIMGLRFGTVNGWAPNLRADVMINAMYNSAKSQGKITVFNKHINRALLGIEDLCRGIAQCIERPQAGIYNMASFNATVEYIAATVAEELAVQVVDKGVTANAYDFGLDTTLFQQTFGFTFTETPATIVDSLIKKYDLSHVERRDNYMIYHWEKEYDYRTR